MSGCPAHSRCLVKLLTLTQCAPIPLHLECRGPGVPEDTQGGSGQSPAEHRGSGPGSMAFGQKQPSSARQRGLHTL